MKSHFTCGGCAIIAGENPEAKRRGRGRGVRRFINLSHKLEPAPAYLKASGKTLISRTDEIHSEPRPEKSRLLNFSQALLVPASSAISQRRLAGGYAGLANLASLTKDLEEVVFGSSERRVADVESAIGLLFVVRGGLFSLVDSGPRVKVAIRNTAARAAEENSTSYLSPPKGLIEDCTRA